LLEIVAGELKAIMADNNPGLRIAHHLQAVITFFVAERYTLAICIINA
jgi:hypothetical protein